MLYLETHLFLEWVDGSMTLGARVWRDILHSQIAKCCNLKSSNKTKLCAAGGCGGDGEFALRFAARENSTCVGMEANKKQSGCFPNALVKHSSLIWIKFCKFGNETEPCSRMPCEMNHFKIMGCALSSSQFGCQLSI